MEYLTRTEQQAVYELVKLDRELPEEMRHLDSDVEYQRLLAKLAKHDS